LTKKLLSQGHKVTAVVRNRNTLSELAGSNGLNILECDMPQYNSLPALLRGPFDAFFHLAWSGVSGDKEKSYQEQINNISATCHAIEAAMSVKCRRFLFASSVKQYLRTVKLGGVVPVSYYGIAKLTARQMCQALSVSSSIKFNSVVFANAFGPEDYSMRALNTIIARMLQETPPKLTEGEYLYDCIFIDDLVDGVISVLENGADQKEYYVGNRRLDSFRNIILRIRDIVNPKIDLVFGEYKDDTFVDYSKIDLDCLYNDTGFEINCDFAEGVRKTAVWIKEMKFV
jgi:nucleoside-diphosphate-sugar epimerase